MFDLVTSDGAGRIYGLLNGNEGRLLYYRDKVRNGTMDWFNGGAGLELGIGWNAYARLVAGDEGRIYAIEPGGDLYFYRVDVSLNDPGNPPAWAHGGVRQKIGEGWHQFTHVVHGGGGLFYAVHENGDLRYYRDLAGDGTWNWDFAGEGQKIGEGWVDFRAVISGDDDGLIYGIRANGDLFYYRDLSRRGRRSWEWGGAARRVGVGWHIFPTVFGGGRGRLYAITVDGFLLYYRDLLRSGKNVVEETAISGWEYAGRGQTVGLGWRRPTDVHWNHVGPIEGYCVPLSASPGQTIEFKISSSTDYTVEYVRLGHGLLGAEPTAVAPFDRPASPWTAPEHACEWGCGWPTSFPLLIPDGWPSGMYAARCTDREGRKAHVVFVVKPDAVRLVPARLALIANTNTWTAYNTWGGGSKYECRVGGSFMRPNPHASPLAPDTAKHLVRGEVWLLEWLALNHYAVDVYTDHDFHRGIPGLQSDYDAILLSTHPEYWTRRMFRRLDRFLESGKNVLYLGGNGVFERCHLNESGTALVFFDGDAGKGRPRNYFRNQGYPERGLLGVASLGFADRLNTAGYRVEVSEGEHWVMAGTGLKAGDPIGVSGLSGGASGWETDVSTPGTSTNSDVWCIPGDDRGAPPAGTRRLAIGMNGPDRVDATPKPEDYHWCFQPSDAIRTGTVAPAHMTIYEPELGVPVLGKANRRRGLVFSAGSITFCGSLRDDEKLTIIVKNVLDHCLRTR